MKLSTSQLHVLKLIDDHGAIAHKHKQDTAHVRKSPCIRVSLVNVKALMRKGMIRETVFGQYSEYTLTDEGIDALL